MREKLDEWLRHNVPADSLLYKDGLTRQCHFVLDLMEKLFLYTASDYDSNMEFDERIKIIKNFKPYVINTHMSKSVRLPVMEMDLSKLGVKVILRDNFYDWCISVESEKDINCDFMGLTANSHGYFEGFPKDRIYDDYSETNRRNFSFCLEDNYQVYTFMFLLRNFLTT